MDYAVIKDGVCVNAFVCESAEFAEKYAVGLGGTAVALAEGYGINDLYENGVWTKGDHPIIEPQPEQPDPDTERDYMLVDHEFRLTLLELGVI